MTHIPQTALPVTGLAPTATDGNPTSEWIQPTDHMMYVVIHVDKDNAATTSFQLRKADDAQGNNPEDFGVNCPIWLNADAEDGTDFVRQDDSDDFTMDNSDDTVQIIVFQVDPSKCDDDKPFVAVTLADGNAGNTAGILYYLAPTRY